MGVFGKHVARLAPLTDAGADDLICSIRVAPLLLGQASQPAAGVVARRGLPLRVSQLAHRLG